MTGDELVDIVQATHGRWVDAIDRAGDRVEVPGAAGDWSVRDVIAHINAYGRFVVLELGGPARPFGELPDHDGNDFQARNEVLHAADVDRSWSDVRAELDEVHGLLLAEVRRRTDDELAMPMVDWAPMSIAEWVTNLTDGHWLEHVADLDAFLRGRDTPR